MQTIGLSAKGKVVGEHRKNRKLTAAQVDELRRLRAEHGWSFKKLGEIFGVSDQNAWQIVRGKTWNVEAVATKQQATEQDKARVLELMAQGFGHIRIARALGVTRYSVYRLMKGVQRAANCSHQ
ncbi:helix-turn-helix domain-containing protein [Bordetella parapertussis]|uniref:helix-turn-helix domain-containing protein n=1 Tax=Bordetella parapertussis TaxID=519 RepID=UPI0003074F2B|nr:helix-turn-helix domain-containing protein [Bordetella parapertussis]